MMMLETFQQGWAGFERYLELMHEPVTITDKEDAFQLENVRGHVEYRHVSFGYGKQKIPS